jgi:nucleoside phosphorylase
MNIAIFSAFPQELSCVRKYSTPVSKPRDSAFPVFITSYRETGLITIETGMNATAIDAAFRHVIGEYRPNIILSIGFGGALYYRADIGDLVFASRFFFHTREGAIELPQLSARNAQFQRSLWNGAITTRLQQKVRIREGSVLTIPQWTAKAKLKPCMPRDAAYPVCDRETVHLAKLAYQNNLPFFGIRAVTDRADEDIPEELFGVVDENGTYRFSRALALLLTRPGLIPSSVRLGRHASLAGKNLWEAVRSLVEVVGSSRMAIQSRLNTYSCRPGLS